MYRTDPSMDPQNLDMSGNYCSMIETFAFVLGDLHRISHFFDVEIDRIDRASAIMTIVFQAHPAPIIEEQLS